MSRIFQWYPSQGKVKENNLHSLHVTLISSCMVVHKVIVPFVPVNVNFIIYHGVIPCQMKWSCHHPSQNWLIFGTCISCSEIRFYFKILSHCWDIDIDVVHQLIYTFFIRKMFIRKWGSNGQYLKTILRKSRGSISKIQYFCWPKIDVSFLLHSKC